MSKVVQSQMLRNSPGCIPYLEVPVLQIELKVLTRVVRVCYPLWRGCAILCGEGVCGDTLHVN